MDTNGLSLSGNIYFNFTFSDVFLFYVKKRKTGTRCK